MSGENEKQGKEDSSANPLIDSVFQQPLAVVYVHSNSRSVLAYIVVSLTRIVGRENIQPLPPYFNDKRKSWGIQVLVKKLPKILTDPKHIAIREALEPPEEPPTDSEV